MATTVDAPAPVRRGHPAGFALALGAILVMMAGASAPSPFYPVLQRDIGFSSAILTGIFAVYAVALLLTLLVTGSLSDHLGRRPVVSGALALLAVSMLAFWHADSVTLLVTARIVQGVASGLLLSSLTATVVDLEPPGRPGVAATANSVMPLAGLALGALVGGAVIDRADAPLAVVFGVLTGVYAVLALAVWLLPETSPRHDGVLRSFRPTVGVPVTARPAFARSAPALFAGWATGGLYLSLGAPIVAQELGGARHVEQGLVVTTLTGVGALSSFVARNRTSREITIYGTTALALGTALTLVALAFGSYWGFIAAAVVAGSGFGTAFLGIMRSITPTVGPDERGELFASVFVVSYLAFGIPAVVAGVAAPHVGLAATTYAYGGLVIVLSATAALLRRYRSTD
ncbi:Inner membrane transport protein YnfM [Nocardioides aquaticus]|uniref:Inner membrane transport protein YnfM n=1 Tax=Nocardioides aquaticus TaxID=160826 RepID=A0ABX8EBK2_9ACTN|nr:MFS transporter [Nocardioides aquaticus]QVT77788.1 Inner membrane transport protein YnfM [Nocardioides aquaticus]